MTQRNTKDSVRSRRIVDGMAKKLFELQTALETFTDDELEGAAKRLQSADQGNCWFVVYDHRDTLLHLIREEQAERSRKRAHVNDSLKLT